MLRNPNLSEDSKKELSDARVTRMLVFALVGLVAVSFALFNLWTECRKMQSKLERAEMYNKDCQEYYKLHENCNRASGNYFCGEAEFCFYDYLVGLGATDIQYGATAETDEQATTVSMFWRIDGLICNLVSFYDCNYGVMTSMGVSTDDYDWMYSTNSVEAATDLVMDVSHPLWIDREVLEAFLAVMEEHEVRRKSELFRGCGLPYYVVHDGVARQYNADGELQVEMEAGDLKQFMQNYHPD